MQPTDYRWPNFAVISLLFPVIIVDPKWEYPPKSLMGWHLLNFFRSSLGLFSRFSLLISLFRKKTTRPTEKVAISGSLLIQHR